MKKSLIIGGLVIGALLLARRFVKLGEFDWEKVFERMPDTAPPKWMFRNITAIRENTDRILERLGERASPRRARGLEPPPRRIAHAFEVLRLGRRTWPEFAEGSRGFPAYFVETNWVGGGTW